MKLFRKIFRRKEESKVLKKKIENSRSNIKGDNNPPEIPTFNGPTNGKVGKEQAYTVSTVDPENNDVYFYIDWGDQTDTGWIGPYSSNEEVTVNHSWSEKGNYTIIR